jgi:hypothetical protein
MGYRGCNYPLIAMDLEGKSRMQSIHRSDYNRKNITEVGGGKSPYQPYNPLAPKPTTIDAKFEGASFTQQVYTDPKMKPAPSKRGAGMTAEDGLVSRSNDKFQITHNNTMTRFTSFT